MRDLKNTIVSSKVIRGATMSSNTTSVSGIIDMQAFVAAELVLRSDAWTDGTFTMTVEVGDNAALSDAVAYVPDAAELDSLAGVVSAADQRAHMGITSDKRYIRVTITSTNVSSGAYVGVDLISRNTTLAQSAAVLASGISSVG